MGAAVESPVKLVVIERRCLRRSGCHAGMHRLRHRPGHFFHIRRLAGFSSFDQAIFLFIFHREQPKSQRAEGSDFLGWKEFGANSIWCFVEDLIVIRCSSCKHAFQPAFGCLLHVVILLGIFQSLLCQQVLQSHFSSFRQSPGTFRLTVFCQTICLLSRRV